MKTITLICLYIAAVIWSVHANSSEKKKFIVHKEGNSSHINSHVRKLIGELIKDLKEKPLTINQTTLSGIHDGIFIALAGKSSSSRYIVKLLDLKPKNKDSESDESDESDEGTHESEED